MELPKEASSIDDILDILQHADIQDWGSYEEYEGEEPWDFEEETLFEGEESEATEEVDVMMDYRQQLETKMKEEQAAKLEEKKEQLRSMIGIVKKKDLSAETIVTPEERESLPPEEVESEDSVHPCLMTVDISDSQLKIANLYTMHSVPKDPGLIQAYRTLQPRRRAYDDDGVDKFHDTAVKMGLPEIQRMKQMLLSDRVDLRYYGVNPRLVKAISQALESNATVRLLSFKDNWLSADACYFLNRLLLTNSTLTELNLAGCRIGASGAVKLCEGISRNPTLITLDLSNCDIRLEGLTSITSAVCENQILQNLNLRGNALDESCANSLQDLVSSCPSLKSLNLSWNSLYKSELWKTLIKGLVKCTLSNLDLSWNALGSESVPHLCKFIIRSPTMENLNLSGNRFTDDDAGPLARSLAKNNIIEELYLGNNAIRDKGVYSFVRAVASQKSAECKLRVLDLENSWAKKDVIPELEAIKKNKPWLDIRLGGILSNYRVTGPNARQILFKRANYEAMKPKNKKHRKNFGHFVLSLKDEPISKGKFRDLVKAFRLKLSESLVNEIINVFPGPKNRIDVHLLKAVYLIEYPDTKLLPKKIGRAKKQSKEKKAKKEKKEKVQEGKGKIDKEKKVEKQEKAGKEKKVKNINISETEPLVK